MGVGGQLRTPAALPPGIIRYPLYRRLGRPQGWSGWVRKILPPPGFDPRTLQPVVSRYTDYAIPAHRGSTLLFRLSLVYSPHVTAFFFFLVFVFLFYCGDKKYVLLEKADAGFVKCSGLVLRTKE